MSNDTTSSGVAPVVSIVIVTRNRCELAKQALVSCFQQDFSGIEVLVYDDASTDRTQEMMREEFPHARYFRHDSAVGYIVLRNRGFRDARGEIVVSIDDDAYFTDSSTISQVVEHFGRYQNAAAIALTFCEPNRGHGPAQLMHDMPDGNCLRGYIGCAHAIRRSVAEELGGYRAFFIHQGEERDLCIRMMDRNYDIVYGSTPPIVHLYSPQRNKPRADRLGTRNTLLFDFLNVPLPQMLGRIVVDAVHLLRYKLSLRDVPRRLMWLGLGLFACLYYWPVRRPVRHATYRRYRSLPSHGPVAADRTKLVTNAV